MKPEPMTCAEVESELEAYVAGALEGATENRLASHLTACPRCASEAALAERVGLELAGLPAFDLPAERLARIKSLAGRDGATEVVWPGRISTQGRGRLWPVALAASLLMAALVAWWPPAEPPAPTIAEVAAAEREARYALALVAQIGRKAGTELRDGVLIERVAVPVLGGVERSLNRVKNGGEGS